MSTYPLINIPERYNEGMEQNLGLAVEEKKRTL